MTEYELLSKDICDQCKKIGSDLITPCGNIECTARIHQECIKAQVEEGKNKCDRCDQPIIVTKTHKFKLETYCNKILMILIKSVLFVICAATPGLLIFGTSVSCDNVEYEKDHKSGWLVGLMITATLVAVPLSSAMVGHLLVGIFINDAYKEYNIRNNIRIMEFIGIENKDHNQQHLIIMCFLLLIVYLVILICHFFGFLILKFIFDMGNLFNYKSFDAGLIFIILCAIISLIIFCIMFCCKKLYMSSVQEEIVFGSTIITEKT